jgi:hypothetical protein
MTILDVSPPGTLENLYFARRYAVDYALFPSVRVPRLHFQRSRKWTGRDRRV